MSKIQFTWIHLVFKIQTYFCKLVLKIKHLQKAQCFPDIIFISNLEILINLTKVTAHKISSNIFLTVQQG
jgi:hypothetical protein